MLAAGSRRVTDEMFLAAARVLSDCVPSSAGADAPLLPPVGDICGVSRHIALAVGREAQRQGLARQMSPEEWEQTLDARRWEPQYPAMRYRA